MADPKTFWLTVTNIAMGAFVIVCFLVVGVGLVLELLRRPRQRRLDRTELNHDMAVMFGYPHPHKWARLHHRK